VSGVPCSDCVNNPALGEPSAARWVGPDNGRYCSIHFTTRFGFYEPLVRLENYEPPTKRKAPAPREKQVKQRRVKA